MPNVGGPAPSVPAGDALTGALGTVALADLLQLLELGRKSGVLAVDAGDGRRGVVHLAEGAVASARFRDARPRGAPTPVDTRDLTDAVEALLALPVGRFAFTPGATPSAPSPRVRVEAVLMAALHRADERARAASDAPPATSPPVPARIPRLLAVDPAVGAPPLRARHWAVLAAVDGRRDAAAVAAACGRDAAAVAATLGDLAAAGLVGFEGAAGVPPTPARSSGP